MPLSTVNAQKEIAVNPARPLHLATFTFMSGTKLRVATHNVDYGGFPYLPRITRPELLPLQAISSQGVELLPGVTIILNDADRSMLTSYEFAEGFKGADLELRFVMWQPYTSDFTSDSLIVFKGICDGATQDGPNLRISATSGIGKMYLPIIRIQPRCPWPFPTPAEQASAYADTSHPSYPCGYSPANGRGTGSFTSCDNTEAACEARGMLTRVGGKVTSSAYGGIIKFPPKTWQSRGYIDGKRVEGTNTGPDQLYGKFVPEVYGTAWVDALCVGSRGDGNSTRADVIVCAGYIGDGVLKVIVNDVEVPRNGSGTDPLFRWNYVTQGGRDGVPNQDLGFDGLGDSYGSRAVIEVVVYRQITDDLSKARIRVLVQGPQVRVYTDPSTYSYTYTENPVWHRMDLMAKTDYAYADLDIATFVTAAAICDATISYTDQHGASASHPRFSSSFVLSQKKQASQIMRSLDNSAGLLVVRNGSGGKVQIYVKGTLASEQPSAVAGSNYNTAVSSKTRAGVTTNGYVAYHFDESNYLADSLAITQPGITDTPNRISFPFINRDNQYVEDILDPIDAADVARVGQEVRDSLDVIGIASFDQAKRRYATVQAERNRGNSRGDTGGTYRVTLTTTMKAVHLRMGNIIAVSAAQYAMTLQLFRVEQIKTDRNGERVTITASWHNDDWYLDTWGQTADETFNAPGRSIPNRAPFAWRPALELPLSGDALYSADDANFSVIQRYADAADGSTISKIEAVGFLPINAPSGDVQVPYAPLQANSASTGGTIAGNQTVYLAFAAKDAGGKYGSPSFPTTSATIPAGTNTNTITASGLRWPGNPTGYAVFAGTSPDRLTLQTEGSGNPSSITLTSLTKSGIGQPDPVFDRVRIDAHAVELDSVYKGVVSAKSGAVLTISGASWTTNVWAGRAISAFAVGPDGTEETISNYTVSSNTSNQLTLDRTASDVNVGDVIAILPQATASSDTSITDSKLALTTDSLKGFAVLIISGTGAGTIARITGNTSTVISIDSQWGFTLGTGSRFVVFRSEVVGSITSTPGKFDTPNVQSSLQVEISNREGMLLVRGVALDSSGREAASAPFRLVYILGSGSTLGISIPGDVVAIGANAFNLTKSVFTDSNGVQYVELTGEYDPPATIGVFTGVTLHVDAPDTSGHITSQDFDYNGDSAGSGSARYGTFRILMAPPASATETWRAYLASYSASYAKPLVLDGDPGETPNRTVSVDPVVSLIPVAPALPTLVTGTQFSSRQNAYSGLLEAGVRTVITWGGSTPDGVQIYLSRDNGTTWEFVSNNVAVLPGPQTIDDWVDAPSSTLTTCRVKAIPFNEVWTDPDQANSSTAVSAQFTISAAAPIAANAITNAVLSGSIGYVKQSDGSWTWGFKITWTNPSDPNFKATAARVQKYDSGGTPVADREGVLRQFADRDGLGAAVEVTIDGNWTIPPTSSGYKFRVYLYAVNQLLTETLQTSAWGGAHPSYLELNPIEPSGSAGAEWAPVVTSVSASLGYGYDETGAQTYYISGSFTPPTDVSYGGCKIVARSNLNGREMELYDCPRNSTSAAGWQSPVFPVPSSAESYDIRFFSYDTSGRLNTYQSGVTPVVSPLNPGRQPGSTSIEYANLVTGFTAGVRYLTSEDGGQKYVFYGSATAPSDVRFMGANVYACISGTFSANGSTTVTRLTGRQFGAELVGRTLQIGGVTRTVSSVTNGDTMVLNSSLSTSTYTYIVIDTGLQVGYMDLTTMRFTSDAVTVTSDAEIFALYACSFDAAGRVNTIVDGTTPKVSLTVQRSTGSTGTENVALVTGFTAAVRYAYAEDGGQRYSFYGAATAPSDQRWAVADVWAAVSGGLSANGTSTVTRTSGREFGQDLVGKTINIAGVIRTVSSVTDSNTMTLNTSMSAGGWTYIMINDAWKVSYMDRTVMNFTTDYWPVTAISESFVLFAVSADTSGRSNTIVNGTTPSVSLTVTRQTGTSGREFADLISSPALDGGAVITINSEIGEQQWFAAGVFTEPSSDPRYGGCKIVRKNTADPDKSIEVADIPRGVSKFRTDFQPSLGVGTILVFLSYDTSGRVNTYQSGITPELSITVPLQGNTLNLVKASPQSLDTAAFAAGLRPVILVSSLPSLPNSLYPLGTVAFNTSTSSLSKSTGTTWVPMVNGGLDIVAGSITADRLVANSITAGQIQAGAIGTSQLAATEILVGGGGGKPTRFRVNDSLGNMVGFVGDNGAGFVGSYFVNLRVGNNINAPNFYADSSQVYLDGVKMTLNLNGVITKIANEFQQGGFNGVMVYDTSTSNAVVIRPGQISMHPAITTGTSFSVTAGASLNCTLTCYDTGSNAKVRLSANAPGAGGIISVHNGTSLQQGVSGTFVFGTRTVTITGGIITNVV